MVKKWGSAGRGISLDSKFFVKNFGLDTPSLSRKLARHVPAFDPCTYDAQASYSAEQNKRPQKGQLLFCSAGRDRTYDQAINSRLLYH
jgi:hypothetical protein